GPTHAAPARTGEVGRGCSGRTDGPGSAQVDGAAHGVTASSPSSRTIGTAMRTALFVSFLLGVAALPAQDREFGTAVPATLAQVRAEPEAYKNVKITFTVQFASLGRISNPFFTKFTP